ncbi:hypothetical protein GGR22_002992 [Flavobacterium gossypii]|uniref:Uncharacterized protein n=1 Tax=Flavobacterium gossypii TaxID=1646119 RepID=A0ABR6DTP7_9FLAO|nr:hypothetical protein [Flavobacterium gossypii]MBA9074819.1 hypothetical protein [Flavobacterium gossypii]
MEQRYINSQQLSEFINRHDLMNNESNVLFNAVISITTVNNKIRNQQMKVMILLDSFGSLGKILLMQSGLDPKLYPTIFEANWQDMEHIDEEYLLIKDVHTKNASIGEYSVKIVPLEKTNE